MNTKIFIERANKKHNGKYDYSLSEFKDVDTKICIICPEHGKFWKLPYPHINGQGCPKCAGRKLTRDDIIEKFREKHGDKYDYSKFEYHRMKDKSTIICKLHGEFRQSAEKHILGRGCPICGNIAKNKNRTITKEKFIERANIAHSGKYDYSNVHFVNLHDKIEIICPIHGKFEQCVQTHLNGHGCPQCAIDDTKLTKDEFVKRASEIHNNKYNYEMAQVNGYKQTVEIICPQHGGFRQTIESHLKGCGCPKCGRIISKNEQEIYEYVCNLVGKENVVDRCRTILSNNKELDIYIPSKKIAIEYNGVLWHSEKYGKDRYYHLEKLNECNERGIRLIQIFEDEYIDKKEIVLSKIRHLLGVDGNKTKIYARKCNVRKVSKETAKEFLDSNHIQGYVNAKLHLGCFYNDKIVGVMSFKKIKDEWELVRFATDNDYVCCGMGGKLFKYFVDGFKPQVVKTFADRRWTIDLDDNLYTKIGFKYDGLLKPEYRYIRNGSYKREHKFNFRKKLMHKRYGLDLALTESQMCAKLGLYKIWDCGLIKYVWAK